MQIVEFDVPREGSADDLTGIPLTEAAEKAAGRVRGGGYDQVVGLPLKRATIPADSKVASIIRGERTLVPRGDESIMPGDRIVVIGSPQAAQAWSQWEGDTISIRGPEARPSKFNEVDFAIAFARIECHFFANHGFFPEEGWILNNAAKLKNIPGWIVQGRFDVVTPMDAAWRLKTAWPGARFEVVWDAGHASTEPGIVDGLVRATDQALSI